MRSVLAVLLISFALALTAPAFENHPNCAPDQDFLADSLWSSSQVLDDVVPHAGNVHALWIVASASWAAIDTAVAHGDTNSIGFPRLPYPRTYAMPYWKDRMFDITRENSLSRYYYDLSQGNHVLTGDIKGHSTNQVIISNFVPDEDTYGGHAFYRDAIARADSVINFADYDTNQDAIVDFLIFNIYGFCDSNGLCHRNPGRMSLRDTVTTNDTLPDGRHLFIDGSGFTIWTPCPEAFPEDNDNAYWIAHGLAAHEYGHCLSEVVYHWAARIGHSQADHIGFGGFDIMCGNSFFDPQNYGQGSTSPHNPAQLLFWDWLTPNVVTAPVWEDTLNDLSSTGDILQIPVCAPQSSGTQYFLITASTRSSVWEQFWPSNGVQINHVFHDPNDLIYLNQYNRKKKLVDMELSTGLWDWQQFRDPTPPSWGASPADDTLWSASRLDSSNTIAGADSFDYCWSHRQDSLQDMFPWWRRGSAGNYFHQGQVFSDTTNPSSRANADTMQNVPTMVYVKVNLVDTLNHICTVTAWNRHWSGTIETDVTWFDSVVVDDFVYVAKNATLTIKPGTKVVFAQGKALLVEGHLIAEGTQADSIYFSPMGTYQWAGISGLEQQSMSLVRCVIRGGTEVYIGGGQNARIDSCHIYNMENGLYYQECKLAQAVCRGSRIEDCSHYGVIGFYGSGLVENTTIRRCTRSGIYWIGDHPDNGTAPLFRGNLITLNGTDSTAIAGGYFNSTTAWLECNTFSYNWPNQILCENQGNPVMNGDYSLMGANHLIADSCVVACPTCQNCACTDPGNYRPLMLLRNSWPHLDGGSNSFRYNHDGVYLSDTGLVCSMQAHIMRGNHYYPVNLPTSSTNFHFCPTSAFYENNPNSMELSCEFGELEPAPDPVSMSYQTAAANETAGNHALAAEQYATLIAENSSSEQALWATRSLLRTELAASTAPQQAHDVLAAVAANTLLSDPVQFGARREAVWALIAGQDYMNARSDLLGILTNPASTADSLWAEIMMALVDYREGGGSYGKQRTTTDLAQTRQRARDFQDRIHRLMGRKTDSEILNSKSGSAVVASKDMATAYPNPFNSIVTIRLNLPEAVKARLEIFNLLGQKVATLADMPLDIGTHNYQWNAESVTSGVYFYKLTAGNHVETHKLMLMK
jgi:M6 family metalloprotease-like protein